MKRLLMAIAIAGLGLAFTGTAGAFTQSATGTMSIGATVVAACTVSTTPMQFGNFNNITGSQNLSTSTITVNCSNNTAYRVDIDAGQNSYDTVFRRVKSGTAPADITNTLTYNLYKASTYLVSDEWGDNGTTVCPACTPYSTGLSGTGSGADQVLTVYGRLESNPNNTSLGAHNDTVTVTVNY